jgi:hypothetical protein
MNAHPDAGARLRRQAAALLIAVAAAAATGRILSTLSAYDPNLFRPENAALTDPRSPWPRTRPGAWPTFGSNDRSRWDAVRALVDHGTWVIGRRGRDTVVDSAPVALAANDVVQLAVLLTATRQHRGRNTVVDSVPVALGANNVVQLAALLAAARQARVANDSGIITEDGWRTVDKALNPTTLEYYSTKPPLLTVLMAGEYWVLKHALGWSITEYPNGVVRTGVWTFNVPLLVVYLVLLYRLAERWGATDWGRLYVLVAGCFATLLTPFLVTFNNHTIATCTALIALYAAVRILEDGACGWGWFALAGFFAGFTACCELPATAYAVGLFAFLVRRCPARTLLAFVPLALLPAAAQLWANYDEVGRLTPIYSELSGPWYQFEGSNFLKIPGAAKRGIDFARAQGETYSMYTFHLLLGHHGWFSLTPIFFLTLGGMMAGVRWLWRGDRAQQLPRRVTLIPQASRVWAQVAVANLLLSAVVIVFYIFQESGNYGGVSSGARWLIWLTPLWLVTLLPAADWLGRRGWGRAVAVALLMLSVLSASYPTFNPWRHPWIYNGLDAWGGIPY